MPTIEINPGDRVKFLNSQGALASEFSYDENGGAIILQDDQGNPADQKVGALEADSLSVGSDGPATSFTDIGGDLNWTKDPNSPGKVDNNASVTFTLDGEYDEVRLDMKLYAFDSNGYLNLQVNGDTDSNYRYVEYNGSDTIGDTSINISDDHRQCENVSVIISGRWQDSCNFNTQSGLKTDIEMSVGANASVESPLESITVLNEYGIEMDIVAYGRDYL